MYNSLFFIGHETLRTANNIMWWPSQVTKHCNRNYVYLWRHSKFDEIDSYFLFSLLLGAWLVTPVIVLSESSTEKKANLSRERQITPAKTFYFLRRPQCNDISSSKTSARRLQSVSNTCFQEVIQRHLEDVSARRLLQRSSSLQNLLEDVLQGKETLHRRRLQHSLKTSSSRFAETGKL